MSFATLLDVVPCRAANSQLIATMENILQASAKRFSIMFKQRHFQVRPAALVIEFVHVFA